MAANPETSTASAVQGIIAGMQEQGFALSLTATGGLAVTPASKLSDHQRGVIRDNRAAIMAHLTAANDPKAHPATNVGTPELTAVDAQIAAAGTRTDDPDRHCWPHSDAMNGSELELMARRLERFARIGLDVDQAEKLADRLLKRDREGDDRYLCIECQHCQHGRCGNSPSAWLQHPVLAPDYALELKRCSGFAPGQGTLAYGKGTARLPANASRLVHPGRAPGPWLTPSEKVAAQEYHLHHAQCSQCQAAGRGHVSRCSAGLALWNQYQGGSSDE